MKRLIACVMACVCACALCALVGCGGANSGSKSSSGSSGSAAMEANDVSMSQQSSSASSEATAQSSASSEAAQSESAAAASSAAGATGGTMLPGFTALSQYPELENGCEITTLTAVLNYEGYPADKCDLSDNYLPKKPVGEANFYREFVGNPRDSEAYGCYAPVIVTTANAYLGSIGAGVSATNLTGTPLRDLFSYVDQGKPVMVWGTQYNQPGYYTVTWVVDGESLTWFRPEHCMALVGYDLGSQLVYVSDPMQGTIVSYDISAFEKNYNDLGQQAIVI